MILFDFCLNFNMVFCFGFRIYLDQYGGEQDLPYMGNSFLFFLEVLKLKDFIHEDQKDDVFLNRKLEALVELYVNCQGSDRKVQIEVSTEDAARMVSQLQHFARVKSGTRVHRLDDVRMTQKLTAT